MNDVSPCTDESSVPSKPESGQAVFQLSINQFENSLDVPVELLAEMVLALEERVEDRNALQEAGHFTSEIGKATNFLMVAKLNELIKFLVTSADRFGSPSGIQDRE